MDIASTAPLLGITGLTALNHWIIEVNESNTQDVSRPFPNLIPTEILVFCLYLKLVSAIFYQIFIFH